MCMYIYIYIYLRYLGPCSFGFYVSLGVGCWGVGSGVQVLLGWRLLGCSLGIWSFRAQGFAFRVKDLRFKVKGSRFKNK